MKTFIKILFVIAMVILLCSCASDKDPYQEVTQTSQEPQPEDWLYKKNGIRLIFMADSKLNLSDGIAHTLHICFYQLRDPNAFNQLSSDQDGLLQLLECFLFDPSVTSFKELIVQPGQTLSIALDRAEGCPVSDPALSGRWFLHACSSGISPGTCALVAHHIRSSHDKQSQSSRPSHL